MELDRIFYIFGSFSRKKQDKRKSLQHQSKSVGNSPLHHRNSQPIETFSIPPRTSVYEDKRRKDLEAWQCGICRKELVEPRLLGCLHSFCTRCLQSLQQEGEVELWNDVDSGSIQLEPGGSSSGSAAESAASGYESEPRDGSDTSWDHDKPHKYGIFTRKISGKTVQLLLCPTCGQETQLPFGGISALPLNYVLLRKMMRSIQDDSENSSVLCDLCSTDNRAESRCSQCLVSVCSACCETHGRQKATARHSLHPLDSAPLRHCSQHPKSELSVYCATCQQVICRDCCLISHAGHALANASRAAAERVRQLRDAAERAKFLPEQVKIATRAINVQALEVDTQAAKVESEISEFVEQYRRSVESHCRALGQAAARARARYRLEFTHKCRELQDRAQQASDAVGFAEEVITQAREDEILSLSGPVLRRLERVCSPPRVSTPKCEMTFSSSPNGNGLNGRLVTTAVDPEKCVVRTDGLQDLLVGAPHSVPLELRDRSGARVWAGGHQVAGYFRRSDSSATPDFARVDDHGDGTYSLVICPSSPGAYLFAVTLCNKPIKGSPFPCAVRVSRPHAGRFHCCAFCSSGGRKDVGCGCGGTMSGGYKGCGHGHAGHPGARHWSCCGATRRRGPCLKAPNNTYQFSL